jgi:hypothetical protein
MTLTTIKDFFNNSKDLVVSAIQNSPQYQQGKAALISAALVALPAINSNIAASTYLDLAGKTALVLLVGKGVTAVSAESYKLYTSTPGALTWKGVKKVGAISLNLLGKAAATSLDLCKKAMGNGDPLTVGTARATILLGALYIATPDLKTAATTVAVAATLWATLKGASYCMSPRAVNP